MVMDVNQRRLGDARLCTIVKHRDDSLGSAMAMQACTPTASASMPNGGSLGTSAAVAIKVEVAASHGGDIVNGVRKKPGTSSYPRRLSKLCSWQICEWRIWGERKVKYRSYGYGRYAFALAVAGAQLKPQPRSCHKRQ